MHNLRIPKMQKVMGYACPMKLHKNLVQLPHHVHLPKTTTHLQNPLFKSPKNHQFVKIRRRKHTESVKSCPLHALHFNSIAYLICMGHYQANPSKKSSKITKVMGHVRPMKTWKIVTEASLSCWARAVHHFCAYIIQKHGQFKHLWSQIQFRVCTTGMHD